MFTLNHFIWLAISAAVAAAYFFWGKKHTEMQVLNVMCGVAIASEVVKIFCMTEFNGTRAVIDSGILPFHLCSIQIFMVLILRFGKNEKLREFLYALSYPAAIVGAMLSLLIPTEGVAFNEVHPYQYFLYHAFLVGFGYWTFYARKHIFTKKSVLQALIGLLLCAWLAFYVNALSGENFMFIVEPPLENLPYLNVDHGWGVYFAHLICAAGVGLVLPYLPVLLRKTQKDKVAV